MANRITIGTFSCSPPEVPPDTPPEDVGGLMIEFWKEKLGKVLGDRPDLILLPEVCDMPRPPYPRDKRDEYRDLRGSRMQDFLAGVAEANRCYVTYPSSRQLEDGTRRNSIVLLDRQGGVAGIYDKTHVVLDEYSSWGHEYGDTSPIIECDFGRVACAICFDIYFEDIRSKIAAARPNLVLFSSMVHGGLLQAQWAYACRAHVVTALYANRPSGIIAPTGDIFATTTNYFDYVTATVNLDCGLFHLDINRPKMKAARAKYGRKLSLHDPGYLGAVLLTSETDEFTVEDVAKEFELESLDGYLDRSLAHCRKHGPAGG